MVMFTKLSQKKLSNVLLNNNIALIEPSFSSLEATLEMRLVCITCGQQTLTGSFWSPLFSLSFQNPSSVSLPIAQVSQYGL